MNRPTWGTVIGILMIVFGGCSVLNNFQAINLPAKLNEKKAMLHEKLKGADTTSIDSSATMRMDTTITFGKSNDHKKAKKTEIDFAKNVLNMPEAAQKWVVRLGYLGFLVALVYILGGAFLLTPKRYSVKLAYSALVLSILFSATKTIILTSPGSASGVIALTMGATQLFSIIIDIILLSVIFASDKEYYTT